jgi:2-isopropylmalate synthase
MTPETAQPNDSTEGGESAEDRVRIFDTTLRDGEQAPGFSMDRRAKLCMAQALEALGVDIIEAGFPQASPDDFAAVDEIARSLRNTTVCALARCQNGDIDTAARALERARHSRIHLFLSTSPLHREHKLGMSKAQVMDTAIASIERARKYCEDVEFSAEDALRTEPEFLVEVFSAAIAAGATTLNAPDTVGYTTPAEMVELFTYLRRHVRDAHKAVFSTHCHDDLGMAVANSLAAVSAGARQVECTINGIGERAGNAALEEIVMALKVRKDIMPFATAINTTMLSKASKLVANVTGFPVQYNKAIVGKNAFSHESGIHQDGMLKNVETYEIMRPEDVGVNATSLMLGKLSGRHAFKDKLESMGYVLEAEAFEDAFKRFKDLADKKKHVFDEDIAALVDDEVMRGQDVLTIKALRVESGTGIIPVASLTMDAQGTVKSVTTSGDGPVDAIFMAIREAYPHTATLQLFQISAVTEGTDAQAQVSVRLEEDGRTVTGKASDTDTMVAAAYAYVNALNKLLVKRQKQAPEPLAVAK